MCKCDRFDEAPFCVCSRSAQAALQISDDQSRANAMKPDASSRHIGGDPPTSGLPAEISLKKSDGSFDAALGIFGGAVEGDLEQEAQEDEVAEDDAEEQGEQESVADKQKPRQRQRQRKLRRSRSFVEGQGCGQGQETGIKSRQVSSSTP